MITSGMDEVVTSPALRSEKPSFALALIQTLQYPEIRQDGDVIGDLQCTILKILNRMLSTWIVCGVEQGR